MTPIYHITHISNLAKIVAENALVCDDEAERRGLCNQSIAYSELKERRRIRQVEKLFFGHVAAGGVLSDYVPFYFANRSPMLYAIHTGQVPQFQGKQNDVVYLVSSAESVAASGCPWCFTNGHAVEGVTEFYDDLKDLPQVNWAVINSWSWKNTLSEPDRKRLKQAEFLVHRSCPWTLVERIGVLNQSIAAQVREIIAGAAHQPAVTIEPNWYYNP
jgi:hypothetical protein